MAAVGPGGVLPAAVTRFVRGVRVRPTPLVHPAVAAIGVRSSERGRAVERRTPIPAAVEAFGPSRVETAVATSVEAFGPSRVEAAEAATAEPAEAPAARDCVAEMSRKHQDENQQAGAQFCVSWFPRSLGAGEGFGRGGRLRRRSDKNDFGQVGHSLAADRAVHRSPASQILFTYVRICVADTDLPSARTPSALMTHRFLEATPQSITVTAVIVEDPRLDLLGTGVPADPLCTPRHGLAEIRIVNLRIK